MKGIMRLEHSATTDPRWTELVKNYQHDWPAAAKNIFGITLSPQQLQVIRTTQQVGSRTTVATGDGTGISHALALVAILRVILYPKGMALIVSEDIKAAQEAIMKYLVWEWGRALQSHPWLDLYFCLTNTGLKERNAGEMWAVIFKGYRVGREEALAGFASDALTVIIPDATTLDDRAFDVLRGGLVGEDNALLLESRADQESGYFYRSHHELFDQFTTITLSSEDSPFVTPKYLEMKAQEYGGRDSEEYRVKILGLFAGDVYDPRYPTMGYNPGKTMPDSDTGLYEVNLSVFGAVSDLGHKLLVEDSTLNNLDGMRCVGWFPGMEKATNTEQVIAYYANLEAAGYEIVSTKLKRLAGGATLVSGQIRFFDSEIGNSIKALLESDDPVYFGVAGTGSYKGNESGMTRIVDKILSFDVAAIPRTGEEKKIADMIINNKLRVQHASS